jgi:hypothetical protein
MSSRISQIHYRLFQLCVCLCGGGVGVGACMPACMCAYVCVCVFIKWHELAYFNKAGSFL